MGSRLFIARGSGRVAAAQAIGEGRFGFGMATPSIAILQTKARSGALPGRAWLWFLSCTTDCRIFQNLTFPKIIETISANTASRTTR